jgi:hypothetical protein
LHSAQDEVKIQVKMDRHFKVNEIYALIGHPRVSRKNPQELPAISTGFPPVLIPAMLALIVKKV